MGNEKGETPEEKSGHAAVRESEERFRTICEHAPIMIDSFGPDGQCTLWNRECERRLGWTQDELSAMDDPLSVFYPANEMRDRVLAAITDADGTFREYEVLAKDATTHYQLWANFALPTGALISVGYDVTDQRAVEAQLRHAQRLDALGQLSGGISHDFNNLLTVILVNTQLIEQVAGDRKDILLRTAEITAAAHHGSELVRKLLAFGSREMLRFETVNLGALIREFATTLRRLIPERIEIELEVHDDLPEIRGDVGAIEQMLINLVTNAGDAIAEQGILRIETFKRSSADGAVIGLAVHDDGAGLSDEIRERMFEPFFTTKPRDEAAGLGLSMVYGLMQQHGGMVEVSSRPGGGTCVELVFPIPKPKQATPRRTAPATPPFLATVMVVEDERSIREAARAVLLGEGYRVLLANDGEQALEIVDAGATIDLIITDVVMPKMGGIELYERLRKRPVMPTIVLTSGYPEGIIAADPSVPVLRKPWSLNALIECVRDNLVNVTK